MALINYSRYKITIDPDSPKTQGLKPGDIVRRQYFDGTNLIYSVMVVLSIGVDKIKNEKTGVKSSHFFIGGLLDGDEPTQGENLDFVRFTNLFDTNRSGALYLTASDDQAPYMDIIDGSGVEKSLCYPGLLGGNESTPSKTRYSIVGDKYITSSLIRRDQDVYRICSLVRNDTPLLSGDVCGIKQLIDCNLRRGSKVLVSYKIRSTTPINDVPIVVSDNSMSNVYGAEIITTSTEWLYCVHMVELPEQQTQLTLQIDISSLTISHKVDIAELNVITLSDICGFSGASKMRLGKLDGVVDSVFGSLHGYGGYMRRLYATEDVGISGTLTAGDAAGFGNTFYAGRIYKNMIINSTNPNISNAYPDMTNLSPVDLCVSKKLSQSTTGVYSIMINTSEWLVKYAGRNVCFSIWIHTSGLIGQSFMITQNQIDVGDIMITHDGWHRYSISFPLNQSPDDAVVSIHAGDKTMSVCAPQIEFGLRVSQYQPTDNVLSEDLDSYGAWFCRGGVGGTIQNPLLQFTPDGDIRSRDGALQIFNGGGAVFTGTVIIKGNDSNVATKEDLSNIDLNNFKGEWSADQVYAKGAIVTYNLKTWVANKEIPAGTEPNSSAIVVSTKDGIKYATITNGKLIQTGSDANGGSEFWSMISDNTVNTAFISQNNNTLATLIGYDSFNDMIKAASDKGQTIISGGYINTQLIKANQVIIDGNGVTSDNLNKTLTHLNTDISTNIDSAFKESIAQSSIYADNTTKNAIDGFADALGGLAFKDLISAALLDETIIVGGYIKTSLIDADFIKTDIITTGYIEGLALNFTSGNIGGWTIDATRLYGGNIDMSVSGGIKNVSGNTTYWDLKTDGSGSLGVGSIKWTSSGSGSIGSGSTGITWGDSGKITLGSDVSLSWGSITDSPEIPTSMDWGSITGNKPNGTYIDKDGVYTGSVVADQIIVGSGSSSNNLNQALDAIIKSVASDISTSFSDAVSQSNGYTDTCTKTAIDNFSASLGDLAFSDLVGAALLDQTVIVGGYIKTSLIDAEFIKTNIITTGYIEGLALNFTSGNIGGWTMSSDKIYGGNITMSVSGGIKNTSGNTVYWDLNNNGSGSLGVGSIRWSNDGSGAIGSGDTGISWRNGNITLGNKVSLSWGSITDSPEIPTSMDWNNITGNKPNGTYIDKNGIYTGYLTASNFKANTAIIESAHIKSINADIITAGTLSVDRIATNSIHGDKITVNTIDGNRIVANTINGDKITANTINGNKILVGSIDADRIKTNTITSLGSVTAGSFNLGNGKFVVTADGALSSTEATISGTITATKGKVGDWSISAGSIITSAESASITVDISNQHFMRINGSADYVGDDGAFMYIRKDNGKALHLYSRNALHIQSQGGQEGNYAIAAYGGIILKPRRGETADVPGVLLSGKLLQGRGYLNRDSIPCVFGHGVKNLSGQPTPLVQASNGSWSINHNLGHTNYIVVANPYYGDTERPDHLNCFVRVEDIETNRVRLRIVNADNGNVVNTHITFAIIGSNF
ncbi:MAG: hypothetical protein ACRDD8_05995 [Bacteroidales bacterium]